ncbi:T9SS type A sorting domain-containing protein [Chryseobacterium mulctrae]|uniref:T9SS type A sorting domain-containing protein n=1 Tax=Chryseobacterium mulctrae TaxID=2576777 RepID=UPI001116E589|nr:T9SS type A sorting domain-containing protein [Chryseobacterium mulctrae]
MKKNLLTIGLLAISLSVQAQNILMHVDTAAKMYVSQGTLVYNGGGLQMKATGSIENHGNFMVVGTSTDSFKTINASDDNKLEADGGGNFVNKLNQENNFALHNIPDDLSTPAVDESKRYTYGQLYISGIPQGNITGIVDQEYRQIRQGDYQQMGIPFYDKTISTLSAELGKTFNTTRYSKNEILFYDNFAAVSKSVTSLNSKFGTSLPSTTYLMIGGLGLDANTQTRTIKGRPFSDSDVNLTLNLHDGGAGANFGNGGYGVNQYNEYYNSYLHDPYEIGSGGQYWAGDFGKNIYQFSNPFLTNLDLRNIAYSENTGTTDNNNLSQLYAVRVEPSGVQYTSSSGSGSTGTYKSITFNAGAPTGDVDYVMIRPFGTFVMKLNDNVTGPDKAFDFRSLRRFNYLPRTESTNYNVAAAKNTTTGTVKQLGIIALDGDGNEVGRTYYVVYPNGTTGHSADSKTQIVGYSTDLINTYEEAPNGGYDMNYTNSYWLYINEANETNFLGKNIKLVNYDLNRAKSYKFEVRENAVLVANGTHQLSTGIGFYYKAQNGTLQPINQGATTSVTHAEYDLYYGEPSSSSVLNTENVNTKPSRTVVVYNPEITNYIVRFDPNWKKADIQVYDMSGKLIISKKDVSASKDFVIELDGSIKNSYLVKIVADSGEMVNTKILK